MKLLCKKYGWKMPWFFSYNVFTYSEETNINFENPDEYSEKINLTAKTVDMEVNTVLSNSFGFGGTNSALVIKKW